MIYAWRRHKGARWTPKTRSTIHCGTRARRPCAASARCASAASAPSEPAGPDLRTLLARSERHVDELRRSASELAAILPTRVEAAVARALGEDEGGLGRRLDQVRRPDRQLAAAVERVERDLLAERMARVEDLEVLVDLVSGGLTSLRADLRAVRRELAELQAVVGQPLHVTVAREQAERAPRP